MKHILDTATSERSQNIFVTLLFSWKIGLVEEFDDHRYNLSKILHILEMGPRCFVKPLFDLAEEVITMVFTALKQVGKRMWVRLLRKNF